MMLRFMSIAGALVVLATRLAIAEDAPKFKTVILPDAIRFVQAFSEDKQAGTMIFDNFVVGTEIGRGTLPSVATKKLTYVLHPESAKEVCVTQDIRGFVSTQASGSATLIVHAGGKTTVVDLKKATSDAKATSRKAKSELRQLAQKVAS